MSDAPARLLNGFISYAHEDDELCQKFRNHLVQLERDGMDAWSDRRLTGGTEWAGAIDEHLNTADIILLLISPEFLASRYCYDVEMKRALERHDQDHARVVPVILRPCDWKHSPFGRFNALPKDGTPVVDWKTPDHGFLNVVEGLRRVVGELSARAPIQATGAGGVKPTFREFPESHLLRWAALAGVLLLAAIWFWWNKQQQYVVEGEKLLDIGRYAEARQPFQQALRWNPLRGQASLGLEVVKLHDLMSKPVEFEQELKQLAKEAPNDAHLKVLEGDLTLKDDPDAALADYQKAANLDPQDAEAHFRMCVLYDLRRNSGRALHECQEAVDRGGSPPHYRANLADQFFKHGDYAAAIREYSKVVDGYPLAKLEMAKIQRLLGKLTEAREQGQLAIEWLENDSVIASLPENSLPWVFEVSRSEAVSIPGEDQKLCYARLELSATLALMGNESLAVENSKRAAQACGTQRIDVAAVVDRELARVADERDELAPSVEAYRKVLATWAK
jgi:tetratricopeptide (TPR) repeat protein